MRLASFVVRGGVPQAGEVDPEAQTVTAFGDATTVLDRLTSGDRTPAGGATHALADVRLLAPVPRPRAIFGIGLNYAAHVVEIGGQAPEAPIVFLKLPSSSAAPNGVVRVPSAVRRLDYEGELALVLGPGATIAGYAVADDLSARDLQGREPQWTRAKGFDESCPWGPWITTTDEVADAGALGLRTHVNGELRQDGNTSDLVFGIDALVAFLAQTCTLEPGDLVLTGTPGGVGQALHPPRFLERGSRVRIEIEALGAIEHEIGEAQDPHR